MSRFSRKILIAIAVFLGLWLIFDLTAKIVADYLWFQELNYLSVLLKKWRTQFLLGTITAGISCVFLWGNLLIASRYRWQWLNDDGWVKRSIPYLRGEEPPANSYKIKPRLFEEYSIPRFQVKTKTETKSVFNLSLLLPLTVVFSVTLAFLVVYYTNFALVIWQRGFGLDWTWDKLLETFATSPLKDLTPYLWVVVFVSLIVFFVIARTNWSLIFLAAFLSFVFSLIMAGNWTLFLQFLQPTLFYEADPQFGEEISFYIFNLPIYDLCDICFNGLFGYGLISIFLYYLLSGNSLAEGRFPGFSRFQIRHLSILGGFLMLSLSWHHWLNRYDLLYYPSGVVYGAGFTTVHVKLPLETALCLVASIIAVWLFINSFSGYKKIKGAIRKKRKILLALIPLFLYLFILIAGYTTSSLVQRFIVLPNELNKETEYITRSITMTRNAFGLDDIETETFNPQGRLTAADIRKNHLTIENIRLWDTRPILQTNRQLQQIRLYYQFPDADIDRYVLEDDRESNKQQVIIAARELDYSAVPDRAKTWVNEHLVYTHGYGFTLSPVNQVDRAGLPDYFVKDIGTEEGGLNLSSEAIRNSIPVENPRIYYGELTDTYIMTNTKSRELDFPSGEENVYTVYQGAGGIPIGGYGLRLLFAEYLKDWQMLFTQNFTPKTKLLFRRDIVERVKYIAPWLRYDDDPYLVVVDTGDEPEGAKPSHLYWILDAYTTSDRYPYSDPGENRFNYIRNSVKVVIDAYNGDVNFYVAELADPIVLTWSKVFPQLFKILGQMPEALHKHIRYPEDLFSILSERLLAYHMTDPQVFYNREDQWEIPQEIYAAEARPVAPYYLIMRLPSAREEEFILLQGYTPTARPNLIAWLAARSDGQKYGRLLLYTFPKQKLVYGPNQIEALINQNPVISQQISLWNRDGSSAIQGNLLVIPIEQSLLYVEPLYLEAEENSVPTLARVIVVYENKIVMKESLDAAIAAIFPS
ncbi:hypothetical protein Xen7305DRAFT_00023270 [Xenococcus sp. PCC 7305]|uniref:UPF0182 family protein n=1 Tax=Xenococcus sp. PCC 7305 TaxID=102125 RepID=UPI0002ACA019|nr:UPF0182 family protein [Xenococcus sp. PCC 7305]ELS02609.1 hypothetical protein Xen7305DRAFT_00023270 [Xenococcus sp. PCC 7305]